MNPGGTWKPGAGQTGKVGTFSAGGIQVSLRMDVKGMMVIGYIMTRKIKKGTAVAIP